MPLPCTKSSTVDIVSCIFILVARWDLDCFGNSLPRLAAQFHRASCRLCRKVKRTIPCHTSLPARVAISVAFLFTCSILSVSQSVQCFTYSLCGKVQSCAKNKKCHRLVDCANLNRDECDANKKKDKPFLKLL